jgi:hypothetical protein
MTDFFERRDPCERSRSAVQSAESDQPTLSRVDLTVLFSFVYASDTIHGMPQAEWDEWLSGRNAAYSVLSIQSGGRSSLPIAVMLLDVVHDRLLFRFRDDLGNIGDEESLPILEGMRDELPNWAFEKGAKSLYLEFLDTLSNTVTISDPAEVPPNSDLPDYLDKIFAKEVANAQVARG